MTAAWPTPTAPAAARGLNPDPVAPDEHVGVANNVRSGQVPINGLRHPREGDSSGWFFWSGGEPSREADFFNPIHAAHLDDWCPAVIPYLELPAGWRFLIAPGYEDVWFDEDLLLKVSGESPPPQ